MSTEKIETKPFNARIKTEDYNFVNEFMKDYPTKHEGFSSLVNVVKTANNPIVLDQKNNDACFDALDYSKLSFEQHDTFLKNIFPETFYQEFSNPDDPKKALTGIINAVNKAKEQPTAPAAIEQKDITAFVPEELKERVEKLRLHLIEKGKGDANSTKEQYLQELLTYSLKYFLDKEFTNI